MGFPLLVKCHLYIELGPWCCVGHRGFLLVSLLKLLNKWMGCAGFDTSWADLASHGTLHGFSLNLDFMIYDFIFRWHVVGMSAVPLPKQNPKQIEKILQIVQLQWHEYSYNEMPIGQWIGRLSWCNCIWLGFVMTGWGRCFQNSITLISEVAFGLTF